MTVFLKMLGRLTPFSLALILICPPTLLFAQAIAGHSPTNVALTESENPARPNAFESFTARFASEERERIWQMTGPFGGDVTALAIDPRAADRVLIGGSDGQLFRSTDGGVSWQRLRPGLKAPGFAATVILFDQEKAGTIYVGVKPQIDLDVETNGGGLYVTEDDGENWREVEGLRGRSIRTLVQSAKDKNVLLAVSRNGVYRTINRGQAWERITPTDDPELRNFHSIATDPRDTNIIYIGTSHLPWKTKDGGKTWLRAGTKETGMIDDSDIMAIHIDEADPDTVLMSACSGIYRTRDASAKWTKLQGIPYTSRRTHVIYQHPTKPEFILSGTTEGLWISGTGGDPKNWRRVTSLRTVINAIAVHPAKPDRIFLGTDNGGVLVSNDGGETYDPSNAGFINRNVRAVLADRTERGRVYAGLIFDDASGGLYVSEDGGLTWQQSMEGMGVRDVYSLYQASSGSDALYAGTNHGLFKSADHGRTWAEVKKVEPMEGERAKPAPGSAPTVAPISPSAVAPPSQPEPASRLNTRPRIIKSVVQTRGKGQTRAQAKVKSRPNTAAQKTKTQGKKPSAKSAKAKPKKPVELQSNLIDLEKQVFALAPFKSLPKSEAAPSAEAAPGGNWLIASTWDGLFVTEDETKGWRPLNVRPVVAGDSAPIQPRINTIATSVHAPGVIYLGAEDGFYVSRDNGETFRLTIIDEESTRIRNITFDPRTAETVYVGASIGFFRSTDGGRTWERRGGGMPLSLDVSSIIISAANPDELYLSDDQRRTLYHSKDRGQNWERLDISQLPSLRLWSISSDPFDAQRLYFGSFSGGVYVMSRR